MATAHTSLSPHAAALAARHAGLESALATEAARPNPDQIAIRRIKAEKLRLKDEIAREAH